MEWVTWSEAELRKMDKVIAPAFNTWASRFEVKGIPAKKGLAEFYAIFEKLGLKDPFVLPR